MAAARVERLACLLGALAFVLGAGGLTLARFWGLEQSLGLDNAYFLQRVWQALFLDEPARTLLNTESGQGLIAGRHVEPSLVLALPWVWMWPRMEGLLLFQSSVFGLAGAGAWRLARAEGAGRLAAVLVAGAVWSMPGLWEVATKDFRSLGLAVPFMIVALAALREERRVLGAVLVVAALGCREEVAWLLLACVPWLGWRKRREALALTALCVIWLVALAIAHDGVSQFTDPSGLASRLPAVLSSDQLPAVSRGLGLALGPLAVALVAAPLAALPVLGTGLAAVLVEGLWSPGGTHLFAGAYVGVILALATAAGRLPDRWSRGLGALALLVSLVGLEHRFGGWTSDVVGVYTGARVPARRVSTPWDVIRRVPDGAPVLTEPWFVAQLAHRPAIYATDDWHDPAAQEQLMDAVGWAVLRVGATVGSHGWRRVAGRQWPRAERSGCFGAMIPRSPI